MDFRCLSKALLVALIFCFVLEAAPSKKVTLTSGSAKLLGAVESKQPFSGERLFATLDSLGGAGTWMEWDVNGVKDPSLMDVLNPLLSANNKPEMVWVITERVRPMVAVLVPKAAGEVLLFYELNALDAKPVPLSINPVLSPEVVFRDYRQVSETEYVHRDRDNLKVKLLKNGFLFSYEKRGEEPLRMDPDYATKSYVEKQATLREYEDYFKYEYSLMLRAFVQSTRGIFNWQPWHWYMATWNSSFMMKRTALEAILVQGVFPPMVTLFKTRTKAGETVELRTNGHGYWEMSIVK